MVKTCPLHPETSAELVGGRGVDCPIQSCKFNNEQTCILLHGAALAIENHVLLGKIALSLGLSR